MIAEIKHRFMMTSDEFQLPAKIVNCCPPAGPMFSFQIPSSTKRKAMMPNSARLREFIFIPLSP
jgi:hypothetical protein